jgi:hypothetical protein
MLPPAFSETFKITAPPQTVSANWGTYLPMEHTAHALAFVLHHTKIGIGAMKNLECTPKLSELFLIIIFF